MHVGFHENKQEFTTHICLNPTFIMCFIKICAYGNLNFDLWSSGLTFFKIIINNMPTKATRCLRKQKRKAEDGANFDVNNTIVVDCKYK